MEELKEISIFLDRFKSFDKGLDNARFRSDHSAFHGLLSGYNSLRTLSENYERKIASQYNIFYVLRNMYKDEERAHSPFLADLFNIEGQHCQRDLFLSRLIKLLKDEFKIEVADLIFANSTVETERETGDGSIDILINFMSPSKKFAIAIENKIYAGDQPKQLERYNRYLEKVYGKSYLLIYLTPHGHIPSEYSIDCSLYNQLIVNKNLILMSYKKHIAEILFDTQNKIEALNVCSLVKQYYNTIINL